MSLRLTGTTVTATATRATTIPPRVERDPLHPRPWNTYHWKPKIPIFALGAAQHAISVIRCLPLMRLRGLS